MLGFALRMACRWGLNKYWKSQILLLKIPICQKCEKFSYAHRRAPFFLDRNLGKFHHRKWNNSFFRTFLPVFPLSVPFSYILFTTRHTENEEGLLWESHVRVVPLPPYTIGWVSNLPPTWTPLTQLTNFLYSMFAENFPWNRILVKH